MYPHQNFTRILKLCSNRPESTCSKNHSPKTPNYPGEYLSSTCQIPNKNEILVREAISFNRTSTRTSISTMQNGILIRRVYLSRIPKSDYPGLVLFLIDTIE